MVSIAKSWLYINFKLSSQSHVVRMGDLKVIVAVGLEGNNSLAISISLVSLFSISFRVDVYPDGDAGPSNPLILQGIRDDKGEILVFAELLLQLGFESRVASATLELVAIHHELVIAGNITICRELHKILHIAGYLHREIGNALKQLLARSRIHSHLIIGVLCVQFLVGLPSKGVELDELHLGVGNRLLVVVEVGDRDREVNIFATRLV